MSCKHKIFYIHVMGFCFSLFFLQKLYSQPLQSLKQYLIFHDSSKHQVQILNNLNFNSNALNNNFLYSGQINRSFSMEEKNSMINQAIFPALGGGDLQNTISYSYKINNKQSLFFNIQHRVHLDFTVDETLYKLIFLGNKPFENSKIQTSTSSFLNWVGYQQIQTGIIHTFSNNTMQLGASVSFLNGSNYGLLQVNDFKLFTDTLGRSLESNISVSRYVSDPEQKKYINTTGIGTSADFFVRIAFPFLISIDSSFANLTLEVNDFGLIRWNEQSTITFLDTSIVNYRGIYINDILQEDSSINNPFTLYSQELKSSFITYLPLFFTMKLEKNIYNHTIEIGIIQRGAGSFRTYYYATHSGKIKNSLVIQSGVSYGGYGKLGLIFGLAINRPHFSFQLGTRQLEGIIFPRYSAGNSIMFNLSKYW